MELVFGMSAEEKQVQLAMLGAISAAMIAAGYYPGEMITQSSRGSLRHPLHGLAVFSMCVFMNIPEHGCLRAVHEDAHGEDS